MRRIVVIHTGGLGDFLQTLPVLRELRDRWPQARLTILGRPPRASLAVAGGLADEALDFETSGCHALFADGLLPPGRPADDHLAVTLAGPVAEALSAAELIVNFLPHETFSRNLERMPRNDRGACPGRAPIRRVVSANSFPAPGECHIPAAQFVYNQVAEALRWPPRTVAPQLTLPPRPGAAADGLGNSAPGTVNQPVAIHPGSGSRSKNWPLERFRELARRLTAAGRPVTWIIGPAELERPEFHQLQQLNQLRQLSPSHAAGRLDGEAKATEMVLAEADLLTVAALLSRARGYVGNDSGVTHLAAALGRPVVAIFGPSEAAVWAPVGEGVRIVQAPAGDLAAVTVEEVRAACEWSASPRE